jgi:hypothetical protein
MFLIENSNISSLRRVHEMNEIIKSFGFNAGKVWETLNAEGPQVQTKLMKKTELRDEEFFGAVGWLARENKICKDKRTYKIGETNLTDKIGTDAGRVWSVLSTKKEMDISTISRLTQLNKKDCYSALGWLAREGKLIAKTVIKKK